MRIVIDQNAESVDKKADIDKSVPTPGAVFSEQLNENGSLENAAKSGCANKESVSRFSGSKICRPAGYC